MAVNIDCESHRIALRDRIDVARRLVLATKLDSDEDLELAEEAVAEANIDAPDDEGGPEIAPQPIDVSREARGLAVLLLFAAYENLLTSLCRTLLEAAAKSRAKGSRLKPGIQMFLLHSELTSLTAGGRSKLWRSGARILDALTNKPARDLDVTLFPADGSFMKSSQIILFCQVFDLGTPQAILREVWPRINTVVDQRNGIAHGRLTAEEVGRGYTHDEVMNLITLWEERWIEFLTWVETSCQRSNAFLKRR